MSSLIGHIVGEYRAEQLIAQGQASVAFRARHQATQQVVTLTIALVPEWLSVEAFSTFMGRFSNRAAQLIRLSHPHILPVLDYGEYCRHPYLVTAASKGGQSVATMLREGRLSQENTLHVIKQVASALDYAHEKGLVHGNLRPAILLLQTGGQLQVSGLEMIPMLEARGIIPQAHQYAHLLNLMGTYLSDPAYLAPECVQGQPADARSDLYSLGLLLFELLSGKQAFSASRGDYLALALQHVQEKPPLFSSRCPELELPGEFDQILTRALAPAPQERFLRAADLVSAYEQLLQKLQVLEQSPTLALSSLTRQASTQVHVSPNARIEGGSAQSGSEPLLVTAQFSEKSAHSASPPVQVAVKESASTTRKAEQSNREQDLALLRQIEEHIWDGYELPGQSQTEPVRSLPLQLFSREAQPVTISRRGLLYLLGAAGALVIGSVGLGAWWMGRLQRPPTQQQQTGAPQQPTLPQAQPVVPTAPQQNTGAPTGGTVTNGALPLQNEALPPVGLVLAVSAPSLLRARFAHWSAQKQARKKRRGSLPSGGAGFRWERSDS